MGFHRSPTDRILGGVCGGMAAKLGWNATLVRILYLVISILPCFAGIPIYVVLWLAVPEGDGD